MCVVPTSVGQVLPLAHSNGNYKPIITGAWQGRAIVIREAIGKLVTGEGRLTGDEAHQVALEILSGEATACQIASFLTALRIRGEGVEHVVGFVRAMRDRAARIEAPPGVVLDTCGTGGDEIGTFNVSTAAAFLAAGAGV